MGSDLPETIPDPTVAIDALIARFNRIGFVGQAELVLALVAVHRHALELEKRLVLLEDPWAAARRARAAAIALYGADVT